MSFYSLSTFAPMEEFKRGITQILHHSDTLTLEVKLKEPNRSAALAWVIEGTKKLFDTICRAGFSSPLFSYGTKKDEGSTLGTSSRSNSCLPLCWQRFETSLALVVYRCMQRRAWRF